MLRLRLLDPLRLLLQPPPPSVQLYLLPGVLIIELEMHWFSPKHVVQSIGPLMH
jgi:hypothetical protein